MNKKLHEKVSKRAYEHFEARGGQHGSEMDDWLKAEKEITAVKKVAKKAKPKRAKVKS